MDHLLSENKKKFHKEATPEDCIMDLRRVQEENPDKFHATAPFDINTGKSKVKKSADY